MTPTRRLNPDALGPEPRFFARSASDRSDDWPYWYIADRKRGNLNVTCSVFPELRGYMPFVSRAVAEATALALAEKDDQTLARLSDIVDAARTLAEKGEAS